MLLHYEKYLKSKTLVFTSFLLLWVIFSFAQNNKEVYTTLSTNNIKIGEQVMLTLHIPLDKNTKVTLVKLADTLSKNIELVNSPLIDTLSINGIDTLNIKYLITSFDSGFWPIPPIPIVKNGDTLFSSVQLITVNTVEVDTSKDIKDIKPLQTAPFTWKEIIPYALAGSIILAAIISFLFWFKKKKKKTALNENRQEYIYTPFELAKQALTDIANNKMWQQGFVKEYHAAIADTLREYLFNQFKLNALEQTTYQTKRSLRHIKNVNDANSKKLIAILELADLVKFAKENPIDDEHELSLEYAHTFLDEVNENYIASTKVNVNNTTTV